MELVNIAYEDAEKTGSSMSFEKPLSPAGHKGEKGGESRVALVFVASFSLLNCFVLGGWVGWGLPEHHQKARRKTKFEMLDVSYQ